MPRQRSRKAPIPRIQANRWPPSQARLEELITEATVDAYGDAEQRGGFHTMIEEHLALRSCRKYSARTE